MDTLTYTTLIVSVFLAGIFLFTYFETPRRTLKKGIKRVKNIQFLNINKSDRTSLTIPSEKKESLKGRSEKDLNIYVHEY